MAPVSTSCRSLGGSREKSHLTIPGYSWLFPSRNHMGPVIHGLSLKSTTEVTRLSKNQQHCDAWEQKTIEMATWSCVSVPLCCWRTCRTYLWDSQCIRVKPYCLYDRRLRWGRYWVSVANTSPHSSNLGIVCPFDGASFAFPIRKPNCTDPSESITFITSSEASENMCTSYVLARLRERERERAKHTYEVSWCHEEHANRLATLSTSSGQRFIPIGTRRCDISQKNLPAHSDRSDKTNRIIEAIHGR